MLSNMASSLIKHKRITTTVAKAKALRKFVEPLLTKSKIDTTHSRRTVFSYLQDKEAVTILFNEISDKIANRPGGYTRIIRTGFRLGDNAETCMIELVDYNELLLQEAGDSKSKTRRGGRRRRKKSKNTETAEQSQAQATQTEEASADTEESATSEALSEDESVEKEDEKKKSDE